MKATARRDRKAWQLAYYKKNRDKRIAYAKKYQKEHREKAREYGRRYYHRNKEVLNRHSSARYYRLKAERVQLIANWFLAHPREYQVHRLEQVLKKIISKKEQQARERKYTRLYMARKRGALCNLTANEIMGLLDTGCFFCGSMEDLALAHDVPTSKNGNTTKGNCFCLCRSCNSKMSDRNLAEVLVQKPLLI